VAEGPAGRIELPHDRNSFFVEYRAASFLAPDRTRFRVRMEGWDEEWVELIGLTRHYYSGLPPGRYRFRVQAAAPDGPWNEAGDSVAIAIRRPPWLSGWAMGAYALLALTGAGAGWRGYRRALQRRRAYQRARQERALAEEQRRIIERLNRSLEPDDLARAIARELRQLTGARAIHLGFVDDRLPQRIVSVPAGEEPLGRARWRERLEAADGREAMKHPIRAGNREVACALLIAPENGFPKLDEERLGLLGEMAGQALHNAMLLERVRALAQRAEQASSAKSEFLAMMSHEIRTPLHGVLGMVELLHNARRDPEQQDILDTLRRSGLQLQRIIDDVLDISRIEAGRLSLDQQAFDLVAMLEQVIDLHAPNASRKGLDLRLRIASDLPLAAVGDGDRLSQVLGNLLNNAVKFTESGAVELSVDHAGNGWLVFVVADSGPGIAEADRQRLFEPFTQLDASITRSHSGSGLGLAICRRLVDAMGGRLELAPPCHSGSRFRVRLPLALGGGETGADRLTALLDGAWVCARVTAPQRRVLHRLCRRWGLSLLEVDAEPQSCRLLLVDPRCLEERDIDRLEAWRDRAGALAWLRDPFDDDAETPWPEADGQRILRWPLVESRFIGLLLDLALDQH
jgi:signal transduction histidine kinase